MVSCKLKLFVWAAEPLLQVRVHEQPQLETKHAELWFGCVCAGQGPPPDPPASPGYSSESPAVLDDGPIPSGSDAHSGCVPVPGGSRLCDGHERVEEMAPCPRGSHTGAQGLETNVRRPHTMTGSDASVLCTSADSLVSVLPRWRKHMWASLGEARGAQGC